MDKKRFISAIFMLLCMTLAITACSDNENDDGNEQPLIVGTWYLINETGYYGHNGVHTGEWNDSYTLDDTEEVYIFNVDGTGQWGQPGFSCQDTRWNILGDRLTVQDVEDVEDIEVLTIKSLSHDTLVLIDEDYDSEDAYVYYEELTFRKLE